MDVAWGDLVFDNRKDVLLGQDQQVFIVELELSSGVLGEEHLIANLNVERNPIAIVIATSLTGRDDRAALRLLLRGIGKNDPAFGRFLTAKRLYDHSIAKWLQLGRGCGRTIAFGRHRYSNLHCD